MAGVGALEGRADFNTEGTEKKIKPRSCAEGNFMRFARRCPIRLREAPNVFYSV
jgi:hypothetical protein